MAAFRLKLTSRSISSLVKFDRHFSTSILSCESNGPLKSSAADYLRQLRAEKNPERIIEICRAAELTPESYKDRIAYSKAIEKLKTLNYSNGIRDFLEESKARKDIKSERSISYFMVLYGQAGMLPEALKTFEEMSDLGVERNAKSLSALLQACRLAKDYKELKRVFNEFPKIYEIVPNLDSYNTMINGLCESGESSSCYSILADMESKGIKPDASTFRPMISSFYQNQKFDEVGKVLEKMNELGISPTLDTYNTRIISLCKLGRSKEAKALFLEFTSNKIKPNSVTYTHLINGFCKEGDLDEAKSLFKQMNDSGISPDSACYYSFLRYLCDAKDFETALDICNQCMSKEWGWVPRFSTMKSLVNGLASISKVDEAKKIIAQVKEKFSKNSDIWTEIEQGLAN